MARIPVSRSFVAGFGVVAGRGQPRIDSLVRQGIWDVLPDRKVHASGSACHPGRGRFLRSGV